MVIEINNKDDMVLKTMYGRWWRKRKCSREGHLVVLLFNRGYSEKAPW